MNIKPKAPELTDFEKAVLAQPRVCHEFNVGKWFGLGEVPAGLVAVRVATKQEQDHAVAGAQEYARKLAEANPKVAEDPDILNDAKSAFIAHAVIRDPKCPDKLPLFNSPAWMMENLTADRIGVLVNLVNEVRIAEGPAPKDISDEMIDGIVRLCVENAGNKVPDAVLANMGREYLSHMVVLLSLRLAAARAPAVPELMGEPAGPGSDAVSVTAEASP